MFQKLRHSDTCNQVKKCIKHGRSDQSQRELTVAWKTSIFQCSKKYGSPTRETRMKVALNMADPISLNKKEITVALSVLLTAHNW